MNRVAQSKPYQVVAMLTGAFAFLGLRRYDLLTPWLPLARRQFFK